MQNPRHRAAAEEQIQAAAKLDPSDPEVYFALADLYGRMDRGDDVLRALREALRWDPGNETAIRRLRELGHDPGGGEGGIFGNLFGR
jgi:cytochrome c-type biogenesis protein CcmH/NrfG